MQAKSAALQQQRALGYIILYKSDWVEHPARALPMQYLRLLQGQF